MGLDAETCCGADYGASPTFEGEGIGASEPITMAPAPVEPNWMNVGDLMDFLERFGQEAKTNVSEIIVTTAGPEADWRIELR